MTDKTKAYIAGAVIVIAAFMAETITASAHGIAWEEAHGQPIITSMYKEEVEKQIGYTDEDLVLIARCVQAEHGNGTELDKRLVVSVILNRLESDFRDFQNMNTVSEVIHAPSQFAVADYYTVETMNAVYKEVQERTDYRVLWFSSRGYQPYGVPIREEGGHFFSGFER